MVSARSAVLSSYVVPHPSAKPAGTAGLRYNRRYYCLAPGYWDYLNESARVLKPGGMRFASDYGYTSANNFPRFLCPDDLSHFQRAMRQPYQLDLTHWVDFAYLSTLALEQGGFWPIQILSLSNLFQKRSHDAAQDAIGRLAFLAMKT